MQKKLCFLGHPAELAARISTQVTADDIEVVPGGDGLEDGSAVVFLVSCEVGMTTEAHLAHAVAVGRTIIPVAILAVETEKMVEPEVLELVEEEARGILSSMIPGPHGAELPFLDDRDKAWKKALLELVRHGGQSVQLQPPSKKVMKSYQHVFSTLSAKGSDSKGKEKKKPWWKLW